MGTTADLPDELRRRARARAAARGESLKEFLTRAVAHELGVAAEPAAHGRVELPLVGSSHPGAVNLTNAEIESALVAEDAGKAGPHWCRGRPAPVPRHPDECAAAVVQSGGG